MRRGAVVGVVVGVFAAGFGFGGGLLVARSWWAAPCEAEFERYARRCERIAMSCEAQQNVLWLARSAGAWARQHGKMPPSAPRTPREVPRGMLIETPDQVWDAAGWTALRFRPGKHLRFSYELETTDRTFAARAYGDLDGDGHLSLYERVGEIDTEGNVVESAGCFIELAVE